MVNSLFERLPAAPWLILALPFGAAVLNTLFFLKKPKIAAGLSIATILGALALSIQLFWFHTHNHLLPAQDGFTWIAIPGLTVEFGYLLDPQSILMLLVVSGVGSLIFIYSAAYMKGDTSYGRFFASLSLFAFSMLGIVLASNLLLLFVFWELVAVSSYLLIGFWFEKPSAADAGNKAFIVNRLADFGFLIGIYFIWALSGLGGAERTFDFQELGRRLPELSQMGLLTPALAGIASLLIFCGVAGKSAQFPLYIWLPDAMEGPTPVSALIHAATMVAAGVYLLCRTFFLVQLSGHEALLVIATIGAVTALLAGGLAVVQNDIKKILAYSTVSQLGFMVLAVGLGGSTEAMYHLTTHAFFKALLFLGAGAMIHALHTQDIWEMGGLLKPMPVTAWTFVIGTLALCGIPPLSGFFSKDEILLLAYEHNLPLFIAGTFGAGLTAFYMTRAVLIAVVGPRRSVKPKAAHGHHHPGEHHAQPHEAPAAMTVPLVLLALLALAGGFLGIPQFLHGSHPAEVVHHAGNSHMVVAILSVLAALGGIGLGWLVYGRLRGHHDPLVEKMGAFHRLLTNKYYLDDFFYGLAGFFQNAVAGVLYWFDLQVVIRRGVDGSAAAAQVLGGLVRRIQTGRVQTYAAIFGFGIVLLAAFTLWKGF